MSEPFRLAQVAEVDKIINMALEVTKEHSQLVPTLLQIDYLSLLARYRTLPSMINLGRLTNEEARSVSQKMVEARKKITDHYKSLI